MSRDGKLERDAVQDRHVLYDEENRGGQYFLAASKGHTKYPNFGFNRKVSPCPSRAKMPETSGFTFDDYDEDSGKSGTNSVKINDDDYNMKKPAAVESRTREPTHEHNMTRSHSRRFLSRFLDCEMNTVSLRRPDFDEDRAMRDAPTHASNDSSTQQILRQSRNYVSTRGRWNDALYPRVDQFDSYDPATINSIRQDSMLSLSNGSMMSKESTRSMISKLTFDDTVSGDTAISRLTFDTQEMESSAPPRSSYNKRLRDKMRGANSNRYPEGVQQLDEPNDERSKNGARFALFHSAGRRAQAENTTQNSVELTRSFGTNIAATSCFVSRGSDAAAQNPEVSTELHRQGGRSDVGLDAVHNNALYRAALPGINRLEKPYRPGADPMEIQTHCAPALRPMQTQHLQRTISGESFQVINSSPGACSGFFANMPQSTMVSNTSAVSNSKRLPIWKERTFPFLASLGVLGCVGFIVLVVVLVVVVKPRSTPTNSLLSGTMEPTSGPTVLWNVLIDDLQSISDSEALLNPESPQHKAAYWLSQMDNLPTDYDLNEVLQRYSLAVIYHALTEAGASTNLSGWLDTERHECEWGTSIICGDSGLSSRKVIALNMRQHSLKGTIPDEIRLLDRLESLQISENAIYGNIPAALGMFSNLHQLEMERNSFTGDIPTAIGALTSLKQLDLSHNFFTSTLPDELFQLKKLQYIDVSFNRLVGYFSNKFAALSFLSTIDIRMNEFTGTFPENLNQLSELARLNVDFNQLSGSFPQTFDFMAKLEELTVSNNLLTGSISNETSPEFQNQAVENFLAGKWMLKKLDISNNFFSGVVPNLIEMLPNMIHIEIKGNMLEGPLPTLSSSSVEHIGAANNYLTGTIQTNFADSLQYLDYSGNKVSGSIPSELATLRWLANLDFSRNKLLNGTLPTELGELRSIQYLALGNCSLTGTLPVTWGDLTILVNLSLEGNHFTGSIPSSYQSLVSLKQLILKNNSLSGLIPSSLSRLSALEVLDLGDNKLIGNVPDELSSLGHLTDLILSGNNLNGSIPVGLCNMLGSEFSNFEDIRIDCGVLCSCCDIRNFGKDCNISASVQRGN